jgi:septal ring factor EnvC (AmiA/AmiB activator)
MNRGPCLSVFLSLILLCSVNIIWGQTQAELDEERKRLLEDIQTTQNLLRKATESRSAAITTLQTLQQQVRSRKSLLKTYQQQIQISRKEIKEIEDSIQTLDSEISVKSEEYAETLRKMYRYKKQSPSWIQFISAQGANQLFRKWVYLSQIEEWQNQQRTQLIAIKEAFEQQKLKKEEAGKILEQRLQKEQQTAAEITKDLNKESKLLEQLKSQESELKQQLQKQQKERAQLDKAIARLIAEASKKSETTSAPDFAATPEGKALSNAFSGNKGKLSWPVKRGIVVRQFGKQKHPTLSNIYIQNNGVDIATEANAPVFALFKGEVMGVIEVPGYQQMVMIRHGSFFTVYSRLKEVYVQKGDQIQTAQEIGRVHFNEKEGQSLVHLEIWNDKEKQNPVQWMAGK